MILNRHGLRVDDHSQITVVGGIVAFECECVIDFVGCAVCPSHWGQRRVPSTACHNIRRLVLVYRSRIALVVMRMSGKHGVWPQPSRGAGAVDVCQHLRASTMIRTTSKWGMMDGDNNRSGEVLAFCPLESRCQKGNLAIIESRVGSFFVGDYAGVFQDVAIKPKYLYKRRVKREVDPWRDHGCAKQTASLRRDHQG